MITSFIPALTRPTTRRTVRRAAVAALVIAPLTVGATACSSSDKGSENSSQTATTSWAPATMAAGIQTNDLWAKAATKDMSAAFGTIRNTGGADVVITGAKSDAGPVQLHTTVKTASGMEMKETPAFTLAKGGTLTLAPGGNHLMFMDLSKPLEPGEQQAITLTFKDGSTTTLQFPVRAYDGAKEKYADTSRHSSEHSGDSTKGSMDMGSHASSATSH